MEHPRCLFIERSVNKDKKTVFFGPFVGEFGWEIFSWYGWVRKMCLTRYLMYHKIACSFPGHHLLYPEVDEFIPLPKWLLEKKLPSRSFITDCWINGLPKAHGPVQSQNYYNLVMKTVDEFRKKLPKDTEFILPWDINYGDKFYGAKFPNSPESDDDFKYHKIPYKEQYFQKIEPTKKSKQLLAKIVPKDQKLISIFPRYRQTRRPDKNWSKENYEKLVERLQQEFPDLKIAIIGTPNGAYFYDGVPKDCIDLINVDDEYRMDYEVAALNQSILAVGGESGGIVFALATGCPTFCWGHVSYAKGFREQNVMGTKQYFCPNTNASVELVMSYMQWILGKDRPPYPNQIKSFALIESYHLIPDFIRESKRLAKIKKKVMG